MLKRLNNIYGQLQNVEENEMSTVAKNLIHQFKADTLSYCRMLWKLDEVTISDCRLALNSIFESVDEKKSSPESVLYQYLLGSRTISSMPRLVRHKPFESSLVNIQQN